MELGWPLPKRKQFLKELLGQKSTKTYLVPFQDRSEYLPVHDVPLGLPLYRLENGRTTGPQAEYLAAHANTPDDFFRADNELAAAQKAQHTLLVKLAKGSKNLFREFEKGVQSEPIILSSTGVVLNGNRRLSTWRSLYEESSTKYKRFRTIQVVVLPFCDDKDLDRLEADLQLKEDLKADYSWTSTALMMREKKRRFKYKDAELTAIYGLPKKEIQELFDCIDYADEYLDSRDMHKRYPEIDDKEYAFRQICRTRPKMKATESEKELFEKAAFCLADEAGAGKRIYAEIPKIADHIDPIRTGLAEELDVPTDGVSKDVITRHVIEKLEDAANFDKARLSIRDTIEAEGAKKTSKKKQDFVVNQIGRARDCLADAKNAIDKRSTKKGAIETLDRIDQLSAALRTWATGDGE
jgi:hypothetical protein